MSENTALSAENVRGVPFKKGFDERRNLEGKPEGTKNFSTIFEQAIKLIVKEQRIPVKDPEVEMVVKAVTKALQGNYQFYKDIMDRTYGSTNKPEVNIDNRTIMLNYAPEKVEQEAIEYLQSRGYNVQKN